MHMTTCVSRVIAEDNFSSSNNAWLCSYLSRNIQASVLTRHCWESLSNELLFLFITDDQKVCSWVQSAAVLAGRLPAKIDCSRSITQVMTFMVREIRGTGGFCNTSKPSLYYFTISHICIICLYKRAINILPQNWLLVTVRAGGQGPCRANLVQSLCC